MRRQIITKTFLWLAGAIGAFIGGSILADPISFHSNAGIVLPTDPSMMSEARAAGAVLLVGGIIIVAGALNRHLTFPALLIAAFLYLSYGLARIVSIGADGLPSQMLLFAAALEVVFGTVGAALAVGEFRLARQSSNEFEAA